MEIIEFNFPIKSIEEWDYWFLVEKLYDTWTGHKYIGGVGSNYLTFMMTDNGKAIGAAQLMIIESNVWHRKWGMIENVYVLPECRGEDISKLLLERLEQKAKELGCAYVKLTSSYDKVVAHSLYHSLGYKLSGHSFKKELK